MRRRLPLAVVALAVVALAVGAPMPAGAAVHREFIGATGPAMPGAGSDPVASPPSPVDASDPRTVRAAFDPGQAVTGGVDGLLGGAAGLGTEIVLRGFTLFVAHGAAFLLTQLSALIDETTSPAIGDQWFLSHYKVMVGLALLLVLPLLLASAVSAIVHQDLTALARSVLLQLPLAMLGTGIAVQLVILALAATDQLCAMVSGGTTSDLKTFFSSLGRLVEGTSMPGNGGFAVLLAAAVLAFGALLLSIELVVRTDAVYVAVLFLPLALAALVWPATARWCRRLVETLVVLILSKFVVVAVISLAASALASGIRSSPGGDGFSSLIAGTSLLLLAAFAPYALLRLVPVLEVGSVAHLEGAGRRVLPSANQLQSAARIAADPSSLAAVLATSAAGTPGEPGAPPEGLRYMGRSADWGHFSESPTQVGGASDGADWSGGGVRPFEAGPPGGQAVDGTVDAASEVGGGSGRADGGFDVAGQSAGPSATRVEPPASGLDVVNQAERQGGDGPGGR